ncbi:HNH endonuclease [Chroococcidiopsis sp. TS-821]|uniref:HNH endonuclease n=1 Tax=Chroococcidiopsis sp. TS-821 TaxID=1378066 RepID=UPI000CEE5770|nr:HNH endonuclease [Chroococcidiopsis sp. TS-821]PPS43534.1 HNH endonuclease [Chroococcidiopsis sp. TS-821]
MIASQVLEQSVVVFSKNYLPISKINVRRAIQLLIAGKAEALDLTQESWLVRSPSMVLVVPAYIRLTVTSVERIWKVPPVNRREVLRRDNYTCQYCGSHKHLTLDHVIPVSRGGLHTWDNVVTACERCNQRKSDRTPIEASMPLHTKPKAPMHPTVAFAEQFWRSEPFPPEIGGTSKHNAETNIS